MQQDPKSRIEKDLNNWKRIEDKLSERYGSKITTDREFLKAKRDVYRYIHKKFKKKQLNQYEKAELRVVRGEHRRMLRQLYPNPYKRLVRNMLVFTGNLIKYIGTAGWRAGKWLISPDEKQYPAAKTSQSNEQGTRTRTTQSQNKAVVRRMPPRPRVQMPVPRASQRMRR